MQFATTTDLASLAVPAKALQGVSAPDQDAALAAASAKLASRMAPRWIVPFTSWGDDLRRYTCDVAAWDLARRRGVDPEDPAIRNLKEAHDEAIAWAEKCGAGTVVPVLLVDSTPAEDEGGPEVASDDPRGWYPTATEDDL